MYKIHGKCNHFFKLNQEHLNLKKVSKLRVIVNRNSCFKLMLQTLSSLQINHSNNIFCNVSFVGFLKSEGLENDYWFVFAYKFSREYSRSEKCGQDVKICTFYTSIFKIFCTFIIHFQRTVKQEEKGDLLNEDDWRVINVLLWQVQYDLMSGA